MPKCTIDGKEIEVAPGTTVIQAAAKLGIEVPHFCYHPDLPIDGNCRMCMVEIEKMPKLQIACNTAVSDGMVVRTNSEKAVQAHRSTLEFLLVNHPIDCPVCDQAGECYLQDNYMEHGLHGSRIELESKVHKRKLVDLGPIMLDAERCVLCSRCLRFEANVTGTNSFEFQQRGDHTSIGTFENRPIEHNYAGNLADVCPVGALLSHDFRFKMRVWFLESTDSVCAGCSTGCNLRIDHRDGVIQRLIPRRNVEVNKSWICDIGRMSYKNVELTSRVAGARVRTASGWQGASLDAALDTLAEKLKAAGDGVAFLASPQSTNEDLFALRLLADHQKGRLDFRVGDPQEKLTVREDNVLLRADRNPNTQGCLDLGMGRSGVAKILKDCESGAVKVLLLQGPELLRYAGGLRNVPFIAVMATHEAPELDATHMVLPAAMWAEVEGTFTNYQRRVQRIRRAVPPPSTDVRSRWEFAADLLRRLGAPVAATSARELFLLLAKVVPDYQALDYRVIGAYGRVLGQPPAAAATTSGAPAGA
jgi:NADH-quinone oxidoreductase subunit G